MHTALVASTGFNSGSGANFLNLAILIALVAISWPLVRKVRKAASENRKRRWIEEGLMDPPPAEPEPMESSDQKRQSSNQADESSGGSGRSSAQ